MTLRELIRKIPDDFLDSEIEIYIPCLRPGDEGTYKLTNAMIDQLDTDPVKIVLESDA